MQLRGVDPWIGRQPRLPQNSVELLSCLGEVIDNSIIELCNF